MICPSCKSSHHAEFPSEIMIHFGGIKNLDKPGVLLFPKLLVCLDCGFLRSTVPAPELASLAAGSRPFDANVAPANLAPADRN